MNSEWRLLIVVEKAKKKNGNDQSCNKLSANMIENFKSWYWTYLSKTYQKQLKKQKNTLIPILEKFCIDKIGNSWDLQKSLSYPWIWVIEVRVGQVPLYIIYTSI